MPIRLSNIRLNVHESELALAREVNRALGLPGGAAPRWRILRKSLDARDKADMSFVYAVEVALAGAIDAAAEEAELVARLNRRRTGVAADLYQEPAFELPAPGASPLPERPLVVGSGPAGVFAAYFLAEQGYRPLVIERGRRVRDRIRDVAAFDAGGAHNPESNYLFGEGGAGTFSDGKLTCRSSGPDVRRVLEVLAAAKGKPSILYDHRPHLGSNRLPAVVKALRQQIEAFGGEFLFDCRLEDVEISEGRVRGAQTSSGHVAASLVLLAIGHSARDTYEMLLARGVPMIQKPFQIGVRIEQPQDQINRAQYGSQPLEQKLGSADYSVVARGPTNLFSFCMCAGGYVMPSVSEPGYFGTNGMSLARRDSPFANSGMMITLEPAQFGSNHPLAGMQVQRQYERLAFAAGEGSYYCPIQRADDFLANRRTTSLPESSYPRGVRAAEIASLVPSQVAQALRNGLPAIDRRWRGKFVANATLVGPESRGSSPVRFLRDEATLESPGIAGLYPIGEGAGYAGGIVSAALDGVRAAKAIIARYAPLERR